MFEKFTDEARRSVVLAQEEARAAEATEIRTEHLLAGVLKVPDTPATALLAFVGADPADVLGDVEALCAVPPPAGAWENPAGHVPFEPATKAAIQRAESEATALGHWHIGPEHLLLGLLRIEHSGAFQLLAARDVTYPAVRSAVAAD